MLLNIYNLDGAYSVSGAIGTVIGLVIDAAGCPKKPTLRVGYSKLGLRRLGYLTIYC